MSRHFLPAGFEDEDDDYYTDSRTLAPSKLKMRVVPNITSGAAMNGENFDSTLCTELTAFLGDITEDWNRYKNAHMIKRKLENKFLSNSDPLLLALKLFANCPGCTNLKNKNLALLILEEICLLGKTHPVLQEAKCNDNTRMVAFNFIKTCGVNSLYKSVIEVYELYKIRELLVPKIRELINVANYKDAANWAIYLKLTEKFSIYDIVVPLILQEKTSLAEEYLKASKTQQFETVKLLDSLLNRAKTVTENCDPLIQQNGYTNINYRLLAYRPMSKLVVRFASIFKITQEHTPNLNLQQRCKHLTFLYYKYTKNEMNIEAWREQMIDIAETKEIQLEIIQDICRDNNLIEALYWVKYFNLDLELFPDTVRSDLESVASEEDVIDAPNIPKTEQNQCGGYLSLDLPFSNVKFIDEEQQFQEMICYLQEQLIIAFDAEWKPFLNGKKHAVMILQMATAERVYLVDCISKDISNDMWKTLGSNVFNNLEILKIAFGLHNDFSELQQSVPLQLDISAKSCYLDMAEMWRRLKNLEVITFPYGNAVEAGEGLTACTEICFGKQLDKSNQCSNWANRPLRHDQMVYAALDAYCLIQLHQFFKKELERLGWNIDSVIDEISTGESGYIYKMKREIQQRKQAELQSDIVGKSSKSQSDIPGNCKFITENSCLDIAKELRVLGIDCVHMIGSGEQKYIEMAKREQRIILYTHANRNRNFMQEVRKSQLLHIPTLPVAEQITFVLQTCRMRIKQDQLYKRCRLCNSCEFICANQAEMYDLCGYKRCQGDNATAQPPKEDKELKIGKYAEMLNVNAHIMRTKTTYHNIPIQLNPIIKNEKALQTNDIFFICDICGNVSWPSMYTIHDSIKGFISN